MTTLRPELRDDELVDIPGMDLEGLVKDAADAAAGDVMEGIETLNSGPRDDRAEMASIGPGVAMHFKKTA